MQIVNFFNLSLNLKKKWYNNNSSDYTIKFSNLANLIKQKKKFANKNPVTSEDSDELTEAGNFEN